MDDQSILLLNASLIRIGTVVLVLWLVRLLLHLYSYERRLEAFYLAQIDAFNVGPKLGWNVDSFTKLVRALSPNDINFEAFDPSKEIADALARLRK